MGTLNRRFLALHLLLLNNFDATNLLLFKDLPNVPLLKKKTLQC